MPRQFKVKEDYKIPKGTLIEEGKGGYLIRLAPGNWIGLPRSIVEFDKEHFREVKEKK